MIKGQQSQLAAALRAGARLAVVFRAADLLAVVLRADARLAVVFRAADLLAAALRAGARLDMAADPPTFTNRCASWFDALTSSSGHCCIEPHHPTRSIRWAKNLVVKCIVKTWASRN